MKKLTRVTPFATRAMHLATMLLSVAVVIASGFVILREHADRNVRSQPSQLLGSNLTISGHSLTSRKGTVVIAMRVGCHFCTASAPFYKRLMNAAASTGISVVGVFSENKGDSVSYLRGLGVPITTLYQSNLDRIYVNGTPTIYILDAKSNIVGVWVGELQPEEETKVINDVEHLRS